jgi:DNA polymerase-1
MFSSALVICAALQAYWGMVYRSNQSFCTSDGIPTTVCFGFLRSLSALLEQEQPHALLVAFDAPAKSFRCTGSQHTGSTR